MTIELSENVINAIADAVVKKMQEPTKTTARWETFVEDYNKCSKCGEMGKFYRLYKYCPKCGAKMAESEDKK